MQTNSATLPLPHPHPWLGVLRREIHLSWQFISGDVSSGIVPALIFFLALFGASRPPPITRPICYTPIGIARRWSPRW